MQQDSIDRLDYLSPEYLRRPLHRQRTQHQLSVAPFPIVHHFVLWLQLSIFIQGTKILLTKQRKLPE